MKFSDPGTLTNQYEEVWQKSHSFSNETRWWFQICFIFTPICGRFPFCSKGLTPPTFRNVSAEVRRSCLEVFFHQEAIGFLRQPISRDTLKTGKHRLMIWSLKTQLGCDIGGAKELGVIYFPTNWGAKEPQNLPNHRVDKTHPSKLSFCNKKVATGSRSAPLFITMIPNHVGTGGNHHLPLKKPGEGRILIKLTNLGKTCKNHNMCDRVCTWWFPT